MSTVEDVGVTEWADPLSSWKGKAMLDSGLLGQFLDTRRNEVAPRMRGRGIRRLSGERCRRDNPALYWDYSLAFS